MQSRRVWLPKVDPIAEFATVADQSGAALADPDGEPVTPVPPTVLIGPEGGWAADERAAGPTLVSAGPGVLRSETAAVAVGARG